MSRYVIGGDGGGPRVIKTSPVPERHLETAMRQVFSVEYGYVLVLMHNRRAVQVKELGENTLGSLAAPKPQKAPQLGRAGIVYRQPIPPAHLAYVTRELFGGENGFYLLRMEDGRVTEIRKVPRDQIAVGKDDLADERVREALNALAEEGPAKAGEGAEKSQAHSRASKRKVSAADSVGIGDDGDGATSG